MVKSIFMKPGQLKPGRETSAVPGGNISARLAAKRRKDSKDLVINIMTALDYHRDSDRTDQGAQSDKR
jgi:hypothetical protein